MNASRDMNPLRGCCAGVERGDDFCAGAYAVPGLAGAAGVLNPDESSAMILRIEARISSMLGSALDSSLDIPYLLRNSIASGPEAYAVLSHHKPCTDDPNRQGSSNWPVWWQVAEIPQHSPE